LKELNKNSRKLHLTIMTILGRSHQSRW